MPGCHSTQIFGQAVPTLSDVGAHCLFLDFDGTLVDIAERPELVRFDAAAIARIASLQRRFGDAVAIVTGRAIADIDRFLAPLVLPVAGVHGQMIRTASGKIEWAQYDQRAVAEACSRLQPLVAREHGLLLETKPGAVALHYRVRPDLAQLCHTQAYHAAATSADLHVVHGKMVVEVKFAGYNKGTAIRALMREAPFAGRRPVFAGDDATDEDGFAVVNALDGITIKIGYGESLALYRLAGTRELLDWLESLVHPP
jgi:trehalose 6-phosphate phosphatase